MNFVEERNKELRGNIDLYNVDKFVIDLSDGSECLITNKTSSSIELYIKKKTKAGINCKQWFYIKDFEKRYG